VRARWVQQSGEKARIVTTHYRYKCPPRKRAKAAAIEAPAIARATSNRGRASIWIEASEQAEAVDQKGVQIEQTPGGTLRDGHHATGKLKRAQILLGANSGATDAAIAASVAAGAKAISNCL
jgi:hypothetical protein